MKGYTALDSAYNLVTSEAWLKAGRTPPSFSDAKFYLIRDNTAVWGTNENNFVEALSDYLSEVEDIPRDVINSYINLI